MEALIKVLFIVTSHSDLGNTGVKTGWFLSEVAHPHDVFTKANFHIDYMSPKGGHAPMVCLNGQIIMIP
jgi:putative intracellular protease/amidase